MRDTMPDTPAPCQPARMRPECRGCARFWAAPQPHPRVEGVDYWQPVIDAAAILWWADSCPLRVEAQLKEAA